MIRKNKFMNINDIKKYAPNDGRPLTRPVVPKPHFTVLKNRRVDATKIPKVPPKPPRLIKKDILELHSENQHKTMPEAPRLIVKSYDEIGDTLSHPKMPPPPPILKRRIHEGEASLLENPFLPPREIWKEPIGTKPFIKPPLLKRNQLLLPIEEETKEKRSFFKNKFLIFGVALTALAAITISISIPLLFTQQKPPVIIPVKENISLKANPAVFNDPIVYNEWIQELAVVKPSATHNNAPLTSQAALEARAQQLSLYFDGVSSANVHEITIVEKAPLTSINNEQFTASYSLLKSKSDVFNDEQKGKQIDFKVTINNNKKTVDLTSNPVAIVLSNAKAYNYLNAKSFNDALIKEYFTSLDEAQWKGIDFSKCEFIPATDLAPGKLIMKLFPKLGYEFINDQGTVIPEFQTEFFVTQNPINVQITPTGTTEKIDIKDFHDFYIRTIINNDEAYLKSVLPNYINLITDNDISFTRTSELLASFNTKASFLQNGSATSGPIIRVEINPNNGVKLNGNNKIDIAFTNGTVTVKRPTASLQKEHVSNQQARNWIAVFERGNWFQRREALFNLLDDFNSNSVYFFDLSNEYIASTAETNGRVLTTLGLKPNFLWSDNSSSRFIIETPIRKIDSVSVTLKEGVNNHIMLDQENFDTWYEFYRTHEKSGYLYSNPGITHLFNEYYNVIDPLEIEKLNANGIALQIFEKFFDVATGKVYSFSVRVTATLGLNGAGDHGATINGSSASTPFIKFELKY
ncbi:MAG: hypothetical protein ACRCVI_02855 [Mycoplasmoidaceae bacterium]